MIKERVSGVSSSFLRSFSYYEQFVQKIYDKFSLNFLFSIVNCYLFRIVTVSFELSALTIKFQIKSPLHVWET